MKLVKPTIESVERELGTRGHLIDFVRMAWHIVEPGNPYINGWHVEAICDHLEAVSRGDIRDLIISMPPGCMKSLTASVFWPVWEWVQRPATKYIYTSYDASLTRGHGSKRLQIILSDWFRERWGDRVLVSDRAAAGDYENQGGGFHFATSVEGKVTGRHADILVGDDTLKAKAVTKKALENVLEWWKSTMASRFRDAMSGRRVLIGQRLHENDLPGAMMRTGDYEVLRLPMRYEPKAASYTRIGGDIRTEPGQLLWPERFPEEAVKKLEKDMGSMVSAAQLQQNPSPEGGAIFKRDWVKHWTVLPARFDLMLQSWDFTFKDEDTSDYVSGQVWGKSGGEYFLIHEVHERMNFSASIEAIQSMTRTYPKAMKKLVEDKANGTGIASVLEKKISGIVLVNPEGGKVARANAVSPLWEAGNVYLPDPEKVSWVDAYVEEIVKFPKGVNDDRVDAMSQALLNLYTAGSSFSEAMAAVRKGLPT